MILQWWTGTVLHSYLALVWMAKRAGVHLVIEFHEMQDVGEVGVPLVGRFTRAGMRMILSRADAVVVHSEFDRRELKRLYPQLADLPIEVISIGSSVHHVRDDQAAGARENNANVSRDLDQLGPEPIRILIFGVVRPYKGHADLASAVRMLLDTGLDVHVSVIGEVWQGYRAPLEEFEAILPDDRLTIVDRYVADSEVPGYFEAADMVVLPYSRSSASGPLHIAMSHGLPVVTTSVGGLTEATAGYTGAVLTPPGDPAALAEGIRAALPLIGMVHADPHSWQRNAEKYAELLDSIDASWCSGSGSSVDGASHAALSEVAK